MKNLFILAAVAAIGTANAVTFTETEGNSTRATGNSFTGVVAGDVITGTTTGTTTGTSTALTSADYFNIGMAAQTAGIYQTQITLTTTGTAGHTGSLRGLSVSGGIASATSDATLQSSAATGTNPIRMNQWYGFGRAHTVQYAVTGGTSTTGAYSATISQTLITPTSLGTVAIGSTTFGITGGLDSEIYLYDANFNVVAFGDDDTTTATQSSIIANLTNGVYYIGVGRYNTASNGINSLANNGGVAGDFLTGPVHANGNFISNNGGNTTTETFGITRNGSAIGSGAFAATERYDVKWYTVEAVPEPATMTAMALGLAAMARRRKKA